MVASTSPSPRTLPPLRFAPYTSSYPPALPHALPDRSASPLALPPARSAPTMATPTMSSAISTCCRRHNVIGRATHRVGENRTLTKITQDSGQRLNSFMILSVTESDNQFPGENRDPRIDRQ